MRIVHLGLGAFHRAHQAALTDAVDDAREWGIAAFTGRSPDAAERLARQDGLYTLVVRGPERDEHRVIESIVEAHDGANLGALRDRLSRPEVALVTITATEAAYLLAPDGTLDATRPDVAREGAVLREGSDPRTMPGRLLDGLRGRFAATAAPIAIVPCDNLPSNGTAIRTAVVGLARLVDPALADDVERLCSFVDTSVDRITPRTTEDDVAAVGRATGVVDAVPVVTEPFVSWVLRGAFPAGRPDWERAGALIVDDLEPYERRKLWLLNGAHTLLALEGLLRGHETVAEAVGDPALRAAIDALWDAAVPHLDAPGLDLPGYRSALLDRFANARIAHRLPQIAADSSVKLRARIVPVIAAERRAGADATAPARAVAAWIAALDRLDALGVPDAEGAPRDRARRAADPLAALVAHLDPELARDAVVLAAVRHGLDTLPPG